MSATTGSTKDSPPLLLLSGLLCDYGFWTEQTRALADVCSPRVAAYGSADTFTGMAEYVLAHAPERFAVAGHSMGGRVAQEICRQAPDRVLGLALLATDYRGPADEAEKKGRDENLERARAMGIRAYGEAWVQRIIAPFRLTDTALIGAIVDMVARQSIEILAAQGHAGITRRDYSELLPQIKCPALLCAGDHDRVRTVEVHKAMADLLPDAELVVIESSGHMVAMEQPDQVTGAMRRWLARL